MNASNHNVRSGAVAAFAKAIAHYEKLSKRANGDLFDVRVTAKTSRGKTVGVEVSRAPEVGKWIVYNAAENKLRYVLDPIAFMRSYARTPGLTITKVQMGYDGKSGLPSNAKSPKRASAKKASPKKK